MEYKKPQPLITVAIIFILISIGVAYYLDKPLFIETKEQEEQIKRLERSNELRVNYEKQIRDIITKLELSNWEEKQEKISIVFDQSPFFLSKTEIFFRDIVIKSGMNFSSVNLGGKSPIKASSQQAQTTTSSSQVNFKPQEGQSQASDSMSQIKGPVNKTEFTLNVSGSYDFFKLLIQNMEKQAFLISIKSVSFSSSENVNNMTFTIRGDVYSY